MENEAQTKRVTAGFKGGPFFKPQVTPPKQFVDGYPKNQNGPASGGTDDPWGKGYKK